MLTFSPTVSFISHILYYITRYFLPALNIFWTLKYKKFSNYHLFAKGDAEGGSRSRQGDRSAALAKREGLRSPRNKTRRGPGVGRRKPPACGAGGETSRGFAHRLQEGAGSTPPSRDGPAGPATSKETHSGSEASKKIYVRHTQ